MIKRLNLNKSFVQLGKGDRTKQKRLESLIKNKLGLKTHSGFINRIKGETKSSEVETKFIIETFKKYCEKIDDENLNQ